MSTKAPRLLICERTGKEFTYEGRGRPPKYHPTIRATVQAEQRKASRDRKAAEKRAAKMEFKKAA